MRGSLTLGRLMGIPFKINYTWFAIFILITLSLAQHYFPTFYPEWTTASYWAAGLVTSILFFASVVTHELAHSYVSIRNGIPVRSITLFVFGGVSHVSREASQPWMELRMAAAGPASSLALGGVYIGLFFLTKGLSEPLGAMTYYLALINGMLAVFNMVPGFPLDGGRVMRSIIWAVTRDYLKATLIACLAGRGIGYLMIFGGVVSILAFDSWLSGLWLAFLGWFLDMAAASSYRHTMLRGLLQGYTAGDLASLDAPVVPQHLTLREFADGYLPRDRNRSFLVAADGLVEGMIQARDLKDVPEGRWDLTTVREAMTPMRNLLTAGPGEDALSVLERMEQAGTSFMAVAEGGRAVGLVEKDRLGHMARLRHRRSGV